MIDGVCDIAKSESWEDPGVWDGKWVRNIAQARFYYAALGVLAYNLHRLGNMLIAQDRRKLPKNKFIRHAA